MTCGAKHTNCGQGSSN